MSTLHIHLLFTHAPLFGVAFGSFALAYALLRKNDVMCDVAYAIFVASGILAGVTYLSGSLAENAAEKLPGVTEMLVDAHQEAAVVALIATLLLGIASAGVLVLRTSLNATWSRSVVSALALAAFLAIGYAANLGGQIGHPEIRSGATVQSSGGQQEHDRGS